MTPAQLTTLKAAILADPALAAQPMNTDGDYNIAEALNQPAAPVFIVWKNSVTKNQVGEAMNSSEVGGLTTANSNRLMVMQAYSDSFNPSRSDTRAGFDSVFGGAGGVLTRAALLILYKRGASRFEKILATGTGTDALPAAMGEEGPVSYSDVGIARRS